MKRSYCFVGFPSAVLVQADGKPAMQKLWGSYLPLTGKQEEGWLEVKQGKDRYWVHESDTQPEGILEVMFLDIGQGDGCLLNLPRKGRSPRKMIIDAGASDNMARFLFYKYRRSRKPVHFESMIISHPDHDHYGGFAPILESGRFSVGTIYHSGLVVRNVERVNWDSLGARQIFNRRNYVTELVANRDDLDRLLTSDKIGRRKYPRLLRDALDSELVGDIRMINAADKHLPKCGPDDSVTLEILGPVPEYPQDHRPALRWLSNLAKTKNGHSIITRLVYGEVSILLGGDLNIPAEDYLLEHYTGEKLPPRTSYEHERLIRKARTVFQSDFAKSCHHGSSDFTEFFLQAVNAHGTVISSGDDEPFGHPHADTLGTIGKHSRGHRSLIFSTELARSTKETIKDEQEFRGKLRQAARAMTDAHLASQDRKIKSTERAFEKILQQIQRSVKSFGAINLRTDGDKAVMAYKIERPRSKRIQWDIYRFTRDSTGELVFDSKH